MAAGPPGQLLDRWRGGDFELVASEALLAELEGVLLRPRFSARATRREVKAYVAGIRRAAVLHEDPPSTVGLRADPADDYLVSLLTEAGADVLVSGPVPTSSGAFRSRYGSEIA